MRWLRSSLAAKPKTTVNAKDIEDQFRIAEYPLPAQAKFTLVNARNAGYLDAAGGGEYELNAVGHNLVAHSLPRGEQATSKPRKRRQAMKPEGLMIPDVLTRLDALGAQLRRGKSVNVNDQQTKESAISMAKAYFAELRPLIVRFTADESTVVSHDEKWQHLIRLAHGNNARQTYLKVIRGLRKELAGFNVMSLSTINAVSASPDLPLGAAETELAPIYWTGLLSYLLCS